MPAIADLPCRFGWHKWEEWETVQEGKIKDNSQELPVGSYARQRRQCRGFGKLQMRTVSTYTGENSG